MKKIRQGHAPLVLRTLRERPSYPQVGFSSVRQAAQRLFFIEQDLAGMQHRTKHQSSWGRQ
jgi:hypothetical protein